MPVKLPGMGKQLTNVAPKGKNLTQPKTAVKVKTPVAASSAHKPDPNAGKKLNVQG